MSIENPLWGAPRIHGELLKLGFEVAQSSVAKLCVPKTSSTWAAVHGATSAPSHGSPESDKTF
jgi:hypothetical protein